MGIREFQNLDYSEAKIPYVSQIHRKPFSAIIMITCFKFYVQTENDDVNGLYEWKYYDPVSIFVKMSFVRQFVSFKRIKKLK